MDESDRDRLYGLPLDEFVRERDTLAGRLRKEGDREAAAEVKALAKPSLVAWTVNQLARRRRDDVERLLTAAERLREAQTSGRGDFADAAAAERDAVRTLTRTAADVLVDAGRPAGEATLDRVSRTLHAAVADDAARRDLECGTLARELEPSGFGSLLEAMPAAKKAPARPRKRDTAKAREALERARARASERAEEAEAAERALADARSELERAEREAERARAAVAAAEEEVKQAERRLEGA